MKTFNYTYLLGNVARQDIELHAMKHEIPYKISKDDAPRSFFAIHIDLSPEEFAIEFGNLPEISLGNATPPTVAKDVDGPTLMKKMLRAQTLFAVVEDMNSK